MAGTVNPLTSPRPRASYRPWIEAGRAPVTWPSSQSSHRAASRASPVENTACHTSRSVAAERSLAGSRTVTPPGTSATAPSYRSTARWVSSAMYGHPRRLQILRTTGKGRPEAGERQTNRRWRGHRGRRRRSPRLRARGRGRTATKRTQCRSGPLPLVLRPAIGACETGGSTPPRRTEPNRSRLFSPPTPPVACTDPEPKQPRGRGGPAGSVSARSIPCAIPKVEAHCSDRRARRAPGGCDSMPTCPPTYPDHASSRPPPAAPAPHTPAAPLPRT